MQMLDRNEINNGHTLIALQWLARHAERLRAHGFPAIAIAAGA